jgi:hypothetical protein
MAKYKAQAAESSKKLERARVGSWAAGIAALVAWFLAFSVLEGTSRYVSALIGLGAVVAAVSRYYERHKTEQQ